MTPFHWALELFFLTLVCAAAFTIPGALLVVSGSLPRWGILTAALGFLVGYPVILLLVVLLPPRRALFAYILILLALGVSRRTDLFDRLSIALRQAVIIGIVGICFWAPGAAGQRVGLF